MNDWILAYLPLVSQAVLACGFALSQYVVLRAGVFSVATAGFASLGAYTAAILTMRLGVPPALSLCASLLVGALAGGILSIPLARLRGVFQAIATLAFVQIVLSVNLYIEPITNGALGINGIPHVVETWHLLLFLAILVYLLLAIGGSSIGRAFDAARQDETVAVALGISVVRYHALAFVLSGAIAGVTGGLYAFHRYSIVPEQFGFALLVESLAAVVLGGRISVAGPIVGAVVLAILPELARGLAEQRYLLHGALLMLVIIYLPDGIVDTIKFRLASRASQRLAAKRIATAGGQP
jgi:branched-chain amino acid transport system permease protein